MYGVKSEANDYRWKHLYNLEINDIFEANITNIQKLFDTYREKQIKVILWRYIQYLVELCEIKLHEKTF
jgi:hypothetical protein